MKALAVAAAIIAAAPAHGQAAAVYDRAVETRLRGDPQGAADLLATLVAGDPAHADAWLQLGLAQLALGRLDAADRSFRQVLALAPDYADARIGLARVEQRRGNRSAALAALVGVPEGNAEAVALRRALAGGGPFRVSFDADLRYSRVDNQRDWREGAVQLHIQAAPGTRIGAGVDVARRFGRTDVFGELTAEHQLSPGTRFYVGAGATPGADFRPRWQLSAGGGVRVAAGANPTDLTIDLRAARYPSGSIQTINPGIEQYLANGRVWLTGRWLNVFDEDGEHRSGWLARADAMASDRLRLFVGAADGPDTSAGVVARTSGLFGGLAYALSDRRTLRLSVAHEDRAGGSDRLELAGGMGVRF